MYLRQMYQPIILWIAELTKTLKIYKTTYKFTKLLTGIII